MDWKDVTSYSRGEERTPRAWDLKIGRLRLSVHQHIRGPGKWFASCEPFFEMLEIGNVGDDVDRLKGIAIRRLTNTLSDHHAKIASLIAV